MKANEQRSSTTLRSLFRQFIVVLRDSRLWIIVLPSLALSGIAIAFLGPRVATVLTLGIGLVASYLVNQIEKLPQIGAISELDTAFQRIIAPAITGIFVAPSSDLLARLWLTPWHWFHTSSEIPSCWFLMTGVAWDWIGVLVCGAVIALLAGRRATFAAMIGVAVLLPLALTDTYRSTDGKQTLTILLSSCQFLRDGTDAADYFEVFRSGIAFGLLSRALLVVFVAKLISSWRAGRDSPSLTT